MCRRANLISGGTRSDERALLWRWSRPRSTAVAVLRGVRLGQLLYAGDNVSGKPGTDGDAQRHRSNLSCSTLPSKPRSGCGPLRADQSARIGLASAPALLRQMASTNAASTSLRWLSMR